MSGQKGMKYYSTVTLDDVKSMKAAGATMADCVSSVSLTFENSSETYPSRISTWTETAPRVCTTRCTAFHVVFGKPIAVKRRVSPNRDSQHHSVPRAAYLPPTFAGQLRARGVDIKTIPQLLGHAYVDTTLNVYTHTISEDETKAISSITIVVFGWHTGDIIPFCRTKEKSRNRQKILQRVAALVWCAREDSNLRPFDS